MAGENYHINFDLAITRLDLHGKGKEEFQEIVGGQMSSSEAEELYEMLERGKSDEANVYLERIYEDTDQLYQDGIDTRIKAAEVYDE